MVVWIDDMYRVPMGRFGRMKMSHMISTSERELHAIAQSIGIKRRWYQGDHYDISISKRKLAIKAGAIEVTMRQLAGIMWCMRNGCPFDSPQDALDLMMRSIKRTVERLGWKRNG